MRHRGLGDPLLVVFDGALGIVIGVAGEWEGSKRLARNRFDAQHGME